MKKLILIGGPMGVGKTTIGKILSTKLDYSTYIEGDLGWKNIPFILTEENKRKVLTNIINLVAEAFLDYDTVILGWVMDNQQSIDTITNTFSKKDVKIFNFSLIASPEAITSRLKADFKNNIRKDDGVIERSIKRLPLFNNINSIKIDTTFLTTEKIVDIICGYIK